MPTAGATRVKKKANKFTLDLASGVTVTARRPSRIKLSNQVAMQTARAALLASQVRAMQQVITNKVLNSASTADTSAAQFALQQQLTESRITASNGALLQTQLNSIAATLDSIERRWKKLKIDLDYKLKQLAKDYIAQTNRIKSALRNARTQAQVDALKTSSVKLNDLYQQNKSNLINLAREEKARLSSQLAENTSTLLAKKLELEKALHAERQTKVLQDQLTRLQGPSSTPSIRAPRKRKIKRKRR